MKIACFFTDLSNFSANTPSAFDAIIFNETPKPQVYIFKKLLILKEVFVVFVCLRSI